MKRPAARARRAAGLGTPVAIIPPAVLGVLFFALPTIALIIRVPWTRLGTIYEQEDLWTAMRLSVESSLEATAVSVILGVPLAWMLARARIRGLSIVRALVIVPLVLPPVIGGLALFAALGRNGVFGGAVRTIYGHDLPFTFPAIVIAQAFVAMPFLVITVEGAFRIADRGIEEAAATLGASRTRIFTTITLPVVLPALLAGAVLCWARALGEFGATLLFGGNHVGVTQTLPTAVYSVYNNDPSAAPAISLPLIAVALIVLGAMRDRWLRPLTVGIV